MATRLNRRHQDSVRSKIQASQLINRLTDHALGKLTNPLDASQVRAIEVLLKKSIPDLQSVEISGDENSPLQVNIVKFGADNSPE